MLDAVAQFVDSALGPSLRDAGDRDFGPEGSRRSRGEALKDDPAQAVLRDRGFRCGHTRGPGTLGADPRTAAGGGILRGENYRKKGSGPGRRASISRTRAVHSVPAP